MRPARGRSHDRSVGATSWSSRHTGRDATVDAPRLAMRQLRDGGVTAGARRAVERARPRAALRRARRRGARARTSRSATSSSWSCSAATAPSCGRAEFARGTRRAAARREPRPRRLPRRGRARRPRRHHRAASSPRYWDVEERMHARGAGRTRTTEVVARGLGAERGDASRRRRASGCSRSSSRSTAARCRRFGCDGVVVLDPDRARPPTRSPRAARWSGRPSTRCCIVPLSARTRCSPARWWCRRPRRSRSRCSRRTDGTGVLWCDGRRTVRPAAGARVEVRRVARPGAARSAALRRDRFTDRLVASSTCPVSGWRGPAS